MSWSRSTRLRGADAPEPVERQAAEDPVEGLQAVRGDVLAGGRCPDEDAAQRLGQRPVQGLDDRFLECGSPVGGAEYGGDGPGVSAVTLPGPQQQAEIPAQGSGGRRGGKQSHVGNCGHYEVAQLFNRGVQGRGGGTGPVLDQVDGERLVAVRGQGREHRVPDARAVRGLSVEEFSGRRRKEVRGHRDPQPGLVYSCTRLRASVGSSALPDPRVTRSAGRRAGVGAAADRALIGDVGAGPGLPTP